MPSYFYVLVTNVVCEATLVICSEYNLNKWWKKLGDSTLFSWIHFLFFFFLCHAKLVAGGQVFYKVQCLTHELL